ncbi:MAG: DUF5320 domain-containing protein [Oscillospiraceae bacterium]|nr:DUF5320 domain-containing protein [Oscillospiraceae bacterium]
MPRRDGTGPMHTGPMNGRGLGSCTGKNTVKNDTGFGLGLTCRRGRGFGRCATANVDSSITRKELLQEQKFVLQSRIHALEIQIESL